MHRRIRDYKTDKGIRCARPGFRNREAQITKVRVLLNPLDKQELEKVMGGNPINIVKNFFSDEGIIVLEASKHVRRKKFFILSYFPKTKAKIKRLLEELV